MQLAAMDLIAQRLLLNIHIANFTDLLYKGDGTYRLGRCFITRTINAAAHIDSNSTAIGFFPALASSSLPMSRTMTPALSTSGSMGSRLAAPSLLRLRVAVAWHSGITRHL
jgi:hypothetical protein